MIHWFQTSWLGQANFLGEELAAHCIGRVSWDENLSGWPSRILWENPTSKICERIWASVAGLFTRSGWFGRWAWFHCWYLFSFLGNTRTSEISRNVMRLVLHVCIYKTHELKPKHVEFVWIRMALGLFMLILTMFHPFLRKKLVAQKEIALTVTAWGSDGFSMPRAITALLVEFLRSRSTGVSEDIVLRGVQDVNDEFVVIVSRSYIYVCVYAYREIDSDRQTDREKETKHEYQKRDRRVKEHGRYFI